MASSALYRYFPSRDDLLTTLIIEAYTALGNEVDEAIDAATAPRAQWRAAATAVRRWAIAHPHEYALLYGSPVPGYQAPQATIAPGSRIPVAVLGIVGRAWGSGTLATPGDELTPTLSTQLTVIAEQLAPGVPEAILARAVIAWTQLFGVVSFELTGQYVGSVDPTDAFFDYSVETMADLLGLRH